jgi:sulfide:quinone oxidoreductase
MPYDLFLGIPKHRAPAVVVESGLTDNGWIPVDPLTLETRFPGVYAVGDVTSVGTPKAGVFSEGQAVVVAERLIAETRGEEGPTYGGVGVCYLEFGGHQVAGVEVTFLQGQAPFGTYNSPSEQLAVAKGDFGTSRVRRWFGKEWSAY